MTAGFLLVLVGLPAAGLAVILFGLWFDWWIHRTTPMPLAYDGLVELRKVLLEREAEN